MTPGDRLSQISVRMVLAIRANAWEYDPVLCRREYYATSGSTSSDPECIVYPVGHTDLGPFGRDARLAEYELAVSVAQKWLLPSFPPRDWVDTLVGMVGDIRALLGDRSTSPVLPGESANGLWVVLPLDEWEPFEAGLMGQKLFFSEFKVRYRELVAY